MWTSKNRARYDRSKLRYPSDLTDEEWQLVEPLIPPGKPGGDKRTVVMREVVNGLMYILSTGCQWRAIPKDLPPKSTVYDYFDLWTYDGTFQRIHHALYEQCREQAEREASPTAAIKDRNSQPPWQKFARICKSTSSSGPIASRDLSFYPNAGSSNARLLGSIAAEGSPRIGRTAIERRWLSCTSPQFGSCSENFVIPAELSGQTLSATMSCAMQKSTSSGTRHTSPLLLPLLVIMMSNIVLDAVG